MKASDLFVKCLEAEGVTQIFGVPGEENAHFMMSLEKAFRAEGPSLVAIPIDYRENALLTQRLGNILCPI